MKNLNSIAYKQLRAGGFGLDPILAYKRKRNAMAFIFVVAMLVVHKVLTELGWAS